MEKVENKIIELQNAKKKKSIKSKKYRSCYKR